MKENKLRLTGAMALLLAISISCAEDYQGWPRGGSIVFPAEAYLGGTVAMAVSSNYTPLTDYEKESYGYHRDNVEVRVFFGAGAGDYETAPVRTAFDISPSPSSRAATVAPGSFATIVVFDLPTALEGQLTGCPCHDVEIKVVRAGSGEEITTGKVRVLGDQDPGAGRGLPSSLGLGFDSDPSAPGNDGTWPLEDALEPQTMIRLRAVHDDGVPAPSKPGFGADPGQKIGAIEFLVTFPRYCMENLRAYPNSEAIHATVMLGPPTDFMSWSYRKVVLVDPNGFTLDKPVNWIVEGHNAGEGPFLDLAFDWTGSPDCYQTLEQMTSYVQISSLLVTDPDGQVLIDIASTDGLLTKRLVDLLPDQ